VHVPQNCSKATINGGPATGLFGYLNPDYAGWHKHTGRWRHLWADRLVMEAATQHRLHTAAAPPAQQASIMVLLGGRSAASCGRGTCVCLLQESTAGSGLGD
jgi:hypothetical protein